jgi:hypothetical protein
MVTVGVPSRFLGDSHIELPCNEVMGPEREALQRELSGVARQHFQALAGDDHSFAKPTFFLGLDGWLVTNILPDGAHERTPGRVELLPNGASGFSKVGDSMCFKTKASLACIECVAVRACLSFHMRGAARVEVAL